ncbi:MAG: tRNA (adenosine(37)-N6)-threonylcarbamoyltransferase complex transferase subunit TsaD [Micavibrio sp.]|nr:MAG: tRNA (adenosine(37)-N6)-threonylcarbamoyltransferase complex transferase subunit TsaD [Micavibrio sp.]
MKILGIESSCDETAVAVVGGDKTILADLVLSQTDRHALYGGVVPEVAARAHMEHITQLTRKAMAEAGLKGFEELDAVAVTAGPGLIGGVMVGAMMAKAVAAVHDLPVYGINHLEGHALTPRLVADVPFPYLLLLASGGHSQIVAVKAVGAYQCLGTTQDDALGEAFDKTAKLLGFGYPGGPAVEKAAAACADLEKARQDFPLPAPMVGRPGCDFSFSGLKTAVRRHVEEHAQMNAADKAALCASFQESVRQVLYDRMTNAARRFYGLFPEAKNPHLVAAGGVAANQMLRGALAAVAAENRFQLTVPPARLCTDNAAMIAWAAAERIAVGKPPDGLDFRVVPRWPLEALL